MSSGSSPAQKGESPMIQKLPVWKARAPIAAAEITHIEQAIEGGLILHFSAGFKQVNAVYVQAYHPVLGGYYLEFLDEANGYMHHDVFQAVFTPLMARGRPRKHAHKS